MNGHSEKRISCDGVRPWKQRGLPSLTEKELTAYLQSRDILRRIGRTSELFDHSPPPRAGRTSSLS